MAWARSGGGATRNAIALYGVLCTVLRTPYLYIHNVLRGRYSHVSPCPPLISRCCACSGRLHKHWMEISDIAPEQQPRAVTSPTLSVCLWAGTGRPSFWVRRPPDKQPGGRARAGEKRESQGWREEGEPELERARERGEQSWRGTAQSSPALPRQAAPRSPAPELVLVHTMHARQGLKHGPWAPIARRG